MGPQEQPARLVYARSYAAYPELQIWLSLSFIYFWQLKEEHIYHSSIIIIITKLSPALLQTRIRVSGVYKNDIHNVFQHVKYLHRVYS